MRKNKQGGFTLIEMLIVVAIIAILVAVSIPVATTALERARVATDAANERAAKAEAVIKYLTDDDIKSTFGSGSATYAYDAANGKLVAETEADSITPYGKCTQVHEPATVPHNGNYNIIWVRINMNGDVDMQWSGTSAPSGWNNNLHKAVVEGDTTT